MCMRNRTFRNIRNEDCEIVSEEAYYGGGSWIVDRWVRMEKSTVEKSTRNLREIYGSDKPGWVE